jgi:hypothetical protein
MFTYDREFQIQHWRSSFHRIFLWKCSTFPQPSLSNHKRAEAKITTATYFQDVLNLEESTSTFRDQARWSAMKGKRAPSGENWISIHWDLMTDLPFLLSPLQLRMDTLAHLPRGLKVE